MATGCLDCKALTTDLDNLSLELELPQKDDLKIDLDVGDLTDGSLTEVNHYGRNLLEWKGSKILDKLCEVMSENLRAQYDSGRIVNKDYADVYSQSLAVTLQQAVTFITTKAQVEASLKTQWWVQLANIKMQYLQLKVDLLIKIAELKIKCCLTQAQIAQTEAQARLLDRQLLGFDDNMYIKLIEFQFQAFSMIYSSGMLDDGALPTPLNNAELSNIYKTYKDRIAEVTPKLLADEKINAANSLYLP